MYTKNKFPILSKSVLFLFDGIHFFPFLWHPNLCHSICKAHIIGLKLGCIWKIRILIFLYISSTYAKIWLHAKFKPPMIPLYGIKNGNVVNSGFSQSTVYALHSDNLCEHIINFVFVPCSVFLEYSYWLVRK